ncbi:hypothetical protein O7614_00705 [Micromonospora sp. WMMD961]|uniref:hypothetical protein n=1 Tax=Micromonospora sp. WMMD961 TaxID=3016100 RepID=UPI002415F681|nr:hypothetical protein [Micromonospora sp. WMMD961]MDG4778164.1 hypothetical protein [Micromonospora sp. WMMD961]
MLFQPPEPDRALPPRPRRAPGAPTNEAGATTSDPNAEQPTPPAAGANAERATRSSAAANGNEPAPPTAEAVPARPSPASVEQPQPTTTTPKNATAEATTPDTTTPATATAKAARRKAGPPKVRTPQTQAPQTQAPQAQAPEDRTPPARTTPAGKTTARKATDTATEVTPSTPAAAKSHAKREATPRKSTTPKKAIPAPVVEQQPPASGRTPESELRAVAARVVDHPGFAPELLALAAVRALGPGAAEWAAQLRNRYPDASADGLARLASRRFVRSAGAGGATAALAGFFAPLAELTSVLWTHANLVLHLAAAYGKDPAHPDRAVELLVLTQVHPDAASAEAALAAAQAAGEPVEEGWPRAAEAAWRLAAPLTAQAGGWVALRLAARLLPGAAMLAAALGDAAAADRLAARTVAAYRPARRGPVAPG